MSINDELSQWNKTLDQGQQQLDDMRRRAIRMKDGWNRRALMRMIRFMERWIERGKRWRNEDIFDDT